ncbi:hypothetical protein JMJ77_0003959, partial [Colletotrichum scovillei]
RHVKLWVSEIRLSCACRIQALILLGIEAPTLGMNANSMLSYAMGFDLSGPESGRSIVVLQVEE